MVPADLPHRESVIDQSARHLALIVEANRQFNLTRITSPREAAIKHVLDSVLPWRHFDGARQVLDVGSGAGFPGLPLALVLPEVEFLLVDSVGKKARFIEWCVRELSISNITVANTRAEEMLRSLKAAVITGRAFAPLDKACSLLGPAIRLGSRALLFKGPDADAEIARTSTACEKQRLHLRVVDHYELPDGLGARTLVEVQVATTRRPSSR